MATQSLHAIELNTRCSDREIALWRIELDAIARSEAVLRILKDRSTVVEEAVRLNVDVDTIGRWLGKAFEAIKRALDDGTALAARRAETEYPSSATRTLASRRDTRAA
jgi:hypothetical protein